MLNCWRAIAHAELSQLCGLMNPSESLKTRDNLKFFVGWVVSVAKLRKHGRMENGIWIDGMMGLSWYVDVIM